LSFKQAGFFAYRPEPRLLSDQYRQSNGSLRHRLLQCR